MLDLMTSSQVTYLSKKSTYVKGLWRHVSMT